jgi:hypothetical protein
MQRMPSERCRPPIERGGLSIDPLVAFDTETSKRSGVPEDWIRAVMHVESGGKPRARSSKAAMGLMQIMPKTWAELRARYRLGADPYDPHDNILAGASYLRELHDRYGAPGFLAAYNAGPRRYEHHLATGRPLAEETQAYVATLACLIGSKQTGREVVAVERSLPWIRSPLFVAHTKNIFSRRSVIVQRAAGPYNKCPHRCRSICSRAASGRPVRAPCQYGSIAMIQIAHHRSLSRNVACSDVSRRSRTKRVTDCRP